MEYQLMEKWLNEGEVTVSRVLLKHYRSVGLTNDDLVTLIQLKSFIDQGNHFPDSSELGRRMGISGAEAFQQIHQLIRKKVLEIKTVKNEEGKSQDQYSLDLLIEKLFIYLKQKQYESVQEEQDVEAKDLYSLFESEFGRPLSPIEIQTLNMWIDEDKYSPELIQMALREAVLSQVYSLKYIDRILLNWEKKNITSKNQVIEESKKHRERQEQKSPALEENPNRKSKPVPMHDWLKDYKDNSFM